MLSWQHFVLIPTSKRNVFPFRLYPPFLYLEMVMVSPQPYSPAETVPRLNTDGSCSPTDPGLLQSPHWSLSTRPDLSQNMIPVDVYLPQWDVCLFHSGITNWLFDPLYTRSLSVKGLASQQVLISHCHRSLPHLCLRRLAPYILSILFPFCWGHFDFESWPPECSWLFPDRSHLPKT